MRLTNTPEKSTDNTFQTSLSGKTQQNSMRLNSLTLTSSQQDSLARLFHWLENGSDLKSQEAHYFLKLLGLQNKNNLNSFSLKTLKDYFITMDGKHSSPSLQPLMSWGMISNGKLKTANIPPAKREGGFSLSELLEKKPLKDGFYKLTLLAHTKANIKQRTQLRKTTWTLDTTKHKFTVNDEFLTPLECERLQGFPDDWTKGISDVQRYKCLGNAVTVPVVEYILSHF